MTSSAAAAFRFDRRSNRVTPTFSRPVSAEAKGRLRQFLIDLEHQAATIRHAIRAVPPAMIAAAVQKSAVGARHALANLARRIPAEPVWRGRRGAAWRFFAPVAVPGDLGLDHPSVAVMVLLLGADGRMGLRAETFGLSFSEHCLGRLLDRSGFKADPLRAMREAHNALLSLMPPDGKRLYELPRLLLPAAEGAFLTVPRPRSDNDVPMMSSVSWVGLDQLWPDQDRTLAAWRAVLAAPA